MKLKKQIEFDVERAHEVRDIRRFTYACRWLVGRGMLQEYRNADGRNAWRVTELGQQQLDLDEWQSVFASRLQPN